MKTVYALAAVAVVSLISASPIYGADKDIQARLVIEDANGTRTYVTEQKPHGLWHKVCTWDDRHPRIWKVCKFGANAFLWGCQIRSAFIK